MTTTWHGDLSVTIVVIAFLWFFDRRFR